MAVYDTMVLAPCDIATYGMGMAASMAQFLLAAGTKGKRFALPHARMLIHQPARGVTGSAAAAAIQAQALTVSQTGMLLLTAVSTAMPLARIARRSGRA